MELFFQIVLTAVVTCFVQSIFYDLRQHRCRERRDRKFTKKGNK